MMQLVNDRICVLNPPKDNLICDAAKVEEILGVPPERVVDVMALRGDSIDNIPGAPGIGDKGSVELIQRFGSVEAVLEHAAEVERKTYRESLQNNRDAVLLSKQLVTIDRNVAVEFEPETMQAQAPDAAAARALFTELEFTSLVQEFLSESIELGETDYREAEERGDVEARTCGGEEARRRAGDRDGIVGSACRPAATKRRAQTNSESEQLSLSRAAAGHPLRRRCSLRVAISAEAGKALTARSSTIQDCSRNARSRRWQTNRCAKTIHDYKSAMHALREHGIALAGVQHDPLLYAYLLDPTTRPTVARNSVAQVQSEAGAIAGRGRRHYSASDGETAR